MICPNCRKMEYTTEKRPDGFSTCLPCGYKARTIEWNKWNMEHEENHSLLSVDEKKYNEIVDSVVNNGGSTDYYKFDIGWSECGDVIEARNMNYNQGNIFKASFCFNIERHSGTDYERELNKIVYFAQRELERIKYAKQ